jgi:hypothetical protein
MLAPNVNDTIGKLTDAYGGFVALDGFAATCFNLQVVKLPDDPEWLPPVRVEIGELNQASGAWRLNSPGLLAPLSVVFIDYISTFLAFCEAVERLDPGDSKSWRTLLQETLLPAATESLKKSRAIEAGLQQARGRFSAVLPELDTAIAQGWDALAAEEKTMLRLSVALGGLFEHVRNLGAGVDSDVIGAGKSYVSSTVSLIYAAVSAGGAATVPILGIITAVLSLGKGFYDIIKNDQDLIAAITQVNAIEAELSDDALGVALTKCTLQMLYKLEAQFAATRDAMPGLIDMWQDEQTKVQNAINALASGAQPDAYLDLYSLPIAKVNWSSVLDYVRKLQSSAVGVGVPITIDIPNARITELEFA